MQAELVLLGSGPSTGVPWIKCLLDRPCVVCADASSDPLSKNRRRNPSLLINFNSSNGIKHILIDVGKTFRDSVETFFKDLKIKSIDGVIITHDHADAILGLDDLRDLQDIKFLHDPETGLSNIQCDQALPLHSSIPTIRRLYSVFPYIFPKPLPIHLANLIFGTPNGSPYLSESASPQPGAFSPLIMTVPPVPNDNEPSVNKHYEEPPNTADLSNNEKRPPKLRFIAPPLPSDLNTSPANYQHIAQDNPTKSLVPPARGIGSAPMSPNTIQKSFISQPMTPSIGTTFQEVFAAKQNAQERRKLGHLSAELTPALHNRHDHHNQHLKTCRSDIASPASNLPTGSLTTAGCCTPAAAGFQSPSKVPVNQMFVASIDVQTFDAFCPFETAGGLSVVPLPVEHGVGYTCWAFELNSPIVLEKKDWGKFERIVYMSDVSMIPPQTLEHLLSGPCIDVLFIDCVYWDGSHPTHMGRPDVMSVLEIVKPKNCILMGMSHLINYHDEKRRQKLSSDGLEIGVNITMGYDGMKIPFTLCQ